MSEFEVLDLLSESKESNQRVQDVGAQSYLSQSALSRVIGRLEKDGLVSRSLCDFDRRGVFVCLTPKGRELYADAKRTHRQVLADTLDA